MTFVRPGIRPDLGDGNANTQSPRTKCGISTCKQIELTSLNEWSVHISLMSLRHIYSIFCSIFFYKVTAVVHTTTASGKRSSPFK